jgi:hypothetical protein
LSWLRALPLLARPIGQTVPWVTLTTGCLAGTGYLAIMAHFAGASHSPLGPGAIRLGFLPALAALAFVPRAPFRPLTRATSMPAWVVPAGQILLSVPVLAVTGWVQLRIAAHTIPAHTVGSPPAVYPVIAQVTGWCAVAVAVAACVDRSRYADLGGAIAAPVSLAAIALVWYAPVISRFLSGPAATSGDQTIAWYAVAIGAMTMTGLAMRDSWHRYTRKLSR